MNRHKTLRQIYSLPVLGYGIRVVRALFKQPKVQENILERLRTSELVVEQLQQSLSDQMYASDNITTEIKHLHEKLSGLHQRQDNVLQALERLEHQNLGNSEKDTEYIEHEKLFANNHELDVFYTNFEDRFRGSEELIIERLREYIPLILENKKILSRAPLLDLGSGRGEFLQLLKVEKINAYGLDINHDMIKRAKKKGLKVVQGDALSYLMKAPSHSIGAISAFHLVEHIPFETLMKLLSCSYRVLTEDGFVIFETPNPENLSVGSFTFYMDPSHLKPIPPALLAFALETCGFRDIEIRRLHPQESRQQDHNHLPADIDNFLYGPRDYAVIGYK